MIRCKECKHDILEHWIYVYSLDGLLWVACDVCSTEQKCFDDIYEIGMKHLFIREEETE